MLSAIYHEKHPPRVNEANTLRVPNGRPRVFASFTLGLLLALHTAPVSVPRSFGNILRENAGDNIFDISPYVHGLYEDDT